MFMEQQFELEEAPPIRDQVFERISIENAIKKFYVEFSCNMNYYLEHQDEIEKDLGQSVDLNHILNNRNELKKLEQELFYLQMSKILDENDDANDCVQQQSNKANNNT
ncbi:unnamed protein product [Brachionus calyciflorus]|uniref:Uncharacterized protein n=1 Tax=Brachionus calyciflorus TaxID=104777 RepID=A0A814FCB9_9BILA|nr:unnamed protein product [Brachionus calyciflorus]